MKYSLLPYTLGRLALLGMGLMTLSACGQILGVESQPQWTEKNCTGTLRVRITTDDENGPVKDISPQFTYGIYDYLRNLNDTEGGLRGCPIEVDVKPAIYSDVSATEKVVEAWRQQPEWKEVSALFILGTGQTTAVAPGLADEKKLVFAGSYAGSLATPAPFDKDVEYPEVNGTGAEITSSENKVSPGYPYVFFPATDYSTGIRVGMQAAWKISPGRIAMLHGPAMKCLYCVDPLAAGKAYLHGLPGMSLGEDLEIPQTSNPMDEAAITTSVTTYIQKEIDKKKANDSYDPVKWFWAGNSIFSTSLMGKAAAEAQKAINAAFPELVADGPKQWKLRIMANNWGIGEPSATLCGQACYGTLYGLFPVPRYGDVDNAKGMIDLLKIHDNYRMQDGLAITAYQDVRYVQGYAAVLMWRKAVEIALDADHITPTGEDLKNALETLKDADLDGMTAGHVTFTPTDHRPQSNEAIYQLDAKGQLSFVNSTSIELREEWLGY